MRRRAPDAGHGSLGRRLEERLGQSSLPRLQPLLLSLPHLTLCTARMLRYHVRAGPVRASAAAVSFLGQNCDTVVDRIWWRLCWPMAVEEGGDQEDRLLRDPRNGRGEDERCEASLLEHLTAGWVSDRELDRVAA